MRVSVILACEAREPRTPYSNAPYSPFAPDLSFGYCVACVRLFYSLTLLTFVSHLSQIWNILMTTSRNEQRSMQRNIVVDLSENFIFSCANLSPLPDRSPRSDCLFHTNHAALQRSMWFLIPIWLFFARESLRATWLECRVCCIIQRKKTIA